MGSPISAPEAHGHGQSPGPGESSGPVQPGHFTSTWGALGKRRTACAEHSWPLENSAGPLLVTVGLSSHLNCLFFLFPSFTPLSFFFLPLFKWGNGCYRTASVKRFSLSFKF